MSVSDISGSTQCQVTPCASLGCPFCSYEKTIFIYKVNEFGFHQCSQCFSIFRSDAEVAISHRYDEDYYGDSPKEKFWLKPVVWMLNIERGNRARFISKRLGKHASVLDIGCGNGALLHKIHWLSGAKVTGVEMDNVAARRARNRGCMTVHSDSFENMPLSENSFDAVMMIHSFEHIPQPEATFRKAVSMLTSGGIFHMAIPNINSIQYSLFGKHWLHLDPEFHLHFIHRDELVRMASKAGLKYVQSRNFNPVQNIPGFILSVMNLLTGRRDILFNLLSHKRKLRNPLNLFLFLLLLIFAIILLPFALIEETISCLLGRGATVNYMFEKIIH